MELKKMKTFVEKTNVYEEESLRGTLFSVLIFVGGGIVFFITLLFVFYLMRV